MKYLSSGPFTVGPAAKQMEGTCLRCAFGERYQHAENCPWRMRLVESESSGTRLTFFDPEKWRMAVPPAPMSTEVERWIDKGKREAFRTMGIEITEDSSIPRDTIYFGSPRKYEVVVDSEGHEHKNYIETEEEWAKRCAVIRNVGTEDK